jgi:hypothetical protein
MRVHLRIAAAFFGAVGVALIAIALLAPPLFSRLALTLPVDDPAQAELTSTALGLTGRFMAIGAALFALPALATGWGVWTRRSWARLTGSALAAMVVIQFPVGTVIGGYLLWVLLSRRSEPWFEPE